MGMGTANHLRSRSKKIPGLFYRPIFSDDRLDFYAAYANKDFTALEAEPTLMFRSKYGAIDGDIIYKDGLYHFFIRAIPKTKTERNLKTAYSRPPVNR